jgi:hypothetical protein
MSSKLIGLQKDLAQNLPYYINTPENAGDELKAIFRISLQFVRIKRFMPLLNVF